MKRIAVAACATALAGAVVFAQSGQTTTQPQQTQPAMPQETKAAAQQLTVVGCVQSEADYRRDHNLGKGGALGTGVGVRNEFVLINASSIPAQGTAGTTGVPPTETTPPTATATPAGTDAYELTGEKESQVSAFVGKRVEIVGKMKAAEKGPAGTTGGATAGRPPTGIDTVSPDLRLREIEVISVRETTGTCPAK